MEGLTIEQMNELESLGANMIPCSLAWIKFPEQTKLVLLSSYGAISKNEKYYSCEVGGSFSTEDLLSRVLPYSIKLDEQIDIHLDGDAYVIEIQNVCIRRESLLECLFVAYKLLLINYDFLNSNKTNL